MGNLNGFERRGVGRINHRAELQQNRDNSIPTLRNDYTPSSEIGRDSKDSIFKSQERKYKTR